jgi:hypothetical protein
MFGDVVNLQLAAKLVGIEKAQPGGPQVRMKESRLARAVWPSHGYENGTPIQDAIEPSP